MVDLRGLPGAALVERGLADLAAGRASAPALAVAAAGARLRRLGLDAHPRIEDAELRLYQELGREDPEAAYGRYNAMLREIASFARALEREQAKGTTA